MENPWGEPSPPLASASAAAPSSSTANRDSTESHASDLDDDAKRAPRLSLELVDEDDDAPAWDAHDDSPDGLDDDADDAWANEARASMRKVNDLVLSDQATEGEQARDAAGLATSLHNGDEEEEETTQVAEPPAAPAPPIPIVPPALPDFDIDAGQQMDDFPEDDHDDETKDGGGDDDFDEFGDAAGAGDQGDDDFGDFGDFGVAAPLDEAAFEAAPATTTTTPLPSTSLASTSPFSSHQQQPFASTSAAATLSYPPLHFDLSGDPSRQSISSQLHDFWQGAFPAAANAVSDEPERQVEGVAQVLVSESSRSLWSELSTLPPLRPVDWRRSRIRREHLISMGFPVSQEEEAPLPSMTAQTSPNPAFSVPARPSSAPPPASSAALSSSQNGLGRPSTPLGTTTTTARGGGTTTSSSVNRSLGPAGLAPAQPPPFDRERAEQALAAADLSLRSLDELRQLDAELDRISVDASELLTHALMMREKETQDKEVYNGMIQDLVIAAAKMKTSSAISSGAGKEPKRSGSGRWKLSK